MQLDIVAPAALVCCNKPLNSRSDIEDHLRPHMEACVEYKTWHDAKNGDTAPPVRFHISLLLIHVETNLLNPVFERYTGIHGSKIQRREEERYHGKRPTEREY